MLCDAERVAEGLWLGLPEWLKVGELLGLMLWLPVLEAEEEEVGEQEEVREKEGDGLGVGLRL